MSSLSDYFQKLILKVESSENITNQGKDDAGFFKPTRAILLVHLNKLKDLHDKPRAKPMVKDSWKFVVENLPPEWLILNDEEKIKMKEMLK